MDFLRQVVHSKTHADDDAAAAAAARIDALCLTIKIPELDDAIHDLNDRLEVEHEKKLTQQRQQRREEDELRHNYDRARQHLHDRLDHNRVVETAHLTPYMEAIKHVQDYMVPGVVAALQTQLCMHLHAMCIHNEQIRLLQQHVDQIIWWYEDMRQQCQQDEANHELLLMNQVVQSKIIVGNLVDQKKLMIIREQREGGDEEQNQDTKNSNCYVIAGGGSSLDRNSNNSLRRTLSRSTSETS